MASDRVPERRSSKSGLLRKQSEIEEADEADTSPGSDQSDATITAGAEVTGATSGGRSPDSVFAEDQKTETDEQANANHLPVHQKVKQLTRSQALCDDTSPPPEQLTTSSSESSSVSQTSSQGHLEKDGSQCSEAGTSSSLSRDSSVDTPYKDSTGIDLEEFIRRTLNKTPKDKNMLLKLETDLNNFIREPKHHYLKFPQMSSYDRMLVHRVAAFFGLDHNVDQTGKCVIVNKTANTRIPDFCFQENIQASDSQQKKKILKRGGLSLDDKESHSKSSEKPNMHDKRAQSLEERKQRYDEARTRIFKKEELQMQYPEDAHVTGIICKASRPSSLGNGREDRPWSSTDSSGYGTDGSSKSRMMAPKAHSFGGITSHTHHPINPYKGSSFSKADSISSGASSSLGSPMARPSFLPPPTPPGSHSDNSSLSRSSSSGPVQSPHPVLTGIVPGQGQQIFWVASDVRSIPPGSTVINPQTGKPFTNADGTEYRHNPNQVPPWPTTSVYRQVSGPQSLFQTPQYATEAVPAGPDQSNQDLLPQFATMMLTQQPAVESSDPSQSLTQQITLTGQSQIQPASMYPGQYYSNPQSVGGQPIRYIYPVNIQHAGAGSQGSVSIETQGPVPGQAQVFPGSGGQFTTQPMQTPQPFVPFPGYHTVSFQGNSGQNPEGFQSTTYQQSSFPVTPSDNTNVTGFTSPTYPVPFSQSGFGQTQNTIFYTVPTSGTPQMGFSYMGQGPFHSTTPPSQGAPTAPNPTATPAINVATATPAMNVATATPAINVAQPVTFGQPSGGPQAGTTQYIQYSYPQFQNQQRAQSPQIVQFPTVQSHPHTPAQNFPIFRPNMQMNMQISQGPVQSQGSALIPGQQIQPSKAFSIDTQVPKLDSGDCKDVGLTCTTFGSPLVTGTTRPAAQVFRAPNQITDVRLIGQPAFRPALQPLQMPQPHIVPMQTHRMGGTQSAQTSKSQKERNRRLKSSSKDGSHNTSQGSDSSDLIQSSAHILEVYDLPSHLKRTDAESLLQDLIASGAKIEFVKREQNQDDKNNSISDYKKIMAVFPDNSVASQILQNHSSNKSYKLRSTNLETGENIGMVG